MPRLRIALAAGAVTMLATALAAAPWIPHQPVPVTTTAAPAIPRTIGPPPFLASDVTEDPAGHAVALVGDDGGYVALSAYQNRIREITTEDDPPVICDDGTLVAFGVADGVRTAGLDTGWEHTVDLPGQPSVLALSPDCGHAATVDADGSIGVLDLGTGTLREVGTVGPVTEDAQSYTAVSPAAFSPDGHTLAVASQTGRVVDIYDVATWTLKETFNSGFTGNIWGLDFAPDNQQVITAVYEGASSAGRMFRHRVGGGAMVSAAITMDPNAIAVSPKLAANGNVVIAVADNNGFVGVMELSATAFTTPTVLTFSGDINNATYAVRFSPDGKLLAAGNRNGTVAFWNIPLVGVASSGAPLTATGMSSINDLAFTPDGQWLGVIASSEASIWNVGTRMRRGRFTPPHRGGSGAFSRTGGVLAVGEVECGKVMLCAD